METQAEKLMVCLLNISLLWPVCEAQLNEISQTASFQAVERGRTVTISCRINRDIRTRVWCKLNPDRRLQMLALTDTFFNMTTYPEQSQRYSVQSDRISSHLTISATTWHDVGTYYCGVTDFNELQFGQGTFLMIKGANMISDSVVQQPETQSVQPGGSVTLNCSVRIVHCAAEHTSVTWLKSSHHSAPQMIYSSGIKNHTCQWSESGETTCVFNLLMKNLSSDDAGTYYCVVSSCGQTLFGNGTGIHVHRDSAESADLSPALIALMLSNILLGMVTLLLVWTLCKKQKKDPTASRSSNESLEGSQTGDGVVYASVYSGPRPGPRASSCRPAPVKYNPDMLVYSHVRYKQQD
ncbi:uncharacterized protein LOC104938772 isoform X2 [Larimichthys crocea]|uniref:uncharacterized protein LOC104938772 isoform X2 n=1 Tax=Larimichthys crocea TaxID=215358 RepID=UPI000901E6AE|nr:uncharacterized protein LOC104938772 isoform X2 [Larimichthys crocea]